MSEREDSVLAEKSAERREPDERERANHESEKRDAETAGEARTTKPTRTSKQTPPATIVAARINAEIRVGPSIASGSQTWSGNCADFPTAPQKISSAETVR